MKKKKPKPKKPKPKKPKPKKPSPFYCALFERRSDFETYQQCVRSAKERQEMIDQYHDAGFKVVRKFKIVPEDGKEPNDYFETTDDSENG